MRSQRSVLEVSSDLLILLGHQRITFGQQGRGGRDGFRTRGGGGRGGCLLEDTLLDLLLLLESLNKGCLETTRVLSLQGFLLIGRHALVAEDGPSFLFSPAGSKVRLALGTGEWLFG